MQLVDVNRNHLNWSLCGNFWTYEIGLVGGGISHQYWCMLCVLEVVVTSLLSSLMERNLLNQKLFIHSSNSRSRAFLFKFYETEFSLSDSIWSRRWRGRRNQKTTALYLTIGLMENLSSGEVAIVHYMMKISVIDVEKLHSSARRFWLTR